MTNIPDSVVEELIPKFRKGMDIQDRKYHGKTYPQCFVGLFLLSILFQIFLELERIGHWNWE
jgi:hypothetical protein